MKINYKIANTKVWGDLYTKISKEFILSKVFCTPGKIFASSSGETCEKKLRYSFEGAPKVTIDPWPGKENKIGNAIHDSVQKDLKLKFGDKVLIENVFPFHLSEKVLINCRIDAVLTIGATEKIIEIKTCKDSEGKEPKEEHYKQLQFYLGVTGLKKGVLSYFKRSNGLHVNSFEVEFDQECYDGIIAKFKRVEDGNDLIIDDTSCTFCEYKTICPSVKKGSSFVRSK